MALNLGAVKTHVQAAAEEFNRQFPGLTIGGWRSTGSVANSDHPKGLAIDIMTTSTVTGTKIAEWAITNAARLNIKYIIWNRRIWQNGAWSGYSGPSPHTDHVHVSFNPTANQNLTGGDTSLGNNPGCNPLALLMLLSFKMIKWGGLVYGAFLTDWII